MNARERVLTSLAHKEPDRVPLFDLAFSTKLASQKLGRECFFPRSGGLNLKKVLLYNKAGRQERLESIIEGINTQIELYHAFGYDVMPLIPQEFIQAVFSCFGMFGSNYPLDVKIEEIGCNRWRVSSEGGFWSEHAYVPEQDAFAAYRDSISEGGEEELERFVQYLESNPVDLSPHMEDALVAIKTAVEHPIVKNGDLFLLGHCDICMPIAEAGFATYLESFILEPELTERFFTITTDALMPVLKAQLELGVDGVIGANDWCCNTGPVISPHFFAEVMAPQLKRIGDMIHQYGKPYIKHLDGKVLPILDTLIDVAGIDAYHSVDPTAGMDIFELKKQYGHKISLWGNVDCGRFMVEGTPDDVSAYCRRLIDECAPGGGYVMATSNAIHDMIPMENLMAMIETCHTYGRRG